MSTETLPRTVYGWTAAVVQLLRERPGERMTGGALLKAVDASAFGVRDASALATLSKMWLEPKGPDDPILNVWRERRQGGVGQQPFLYWYDPLSKRPFGTHSPRSRRMAKATTPAPPLGPSATSDRMKQLQWARANQHSNEAQIRAVARDILAEHERDPGKAEPMRQGQRTEADRLADRLSKRKGRLRREFGEHLSSKQIDRFVALTKDYDMGEYRSASASALRILEYLAAKAEPAPVTPLQERVEEVRQVAEAHPIPEKVVDGAKPLPPDPPKEGFDVGDLIEVIGFAKNREPLVRDAAGNLYRIAIVEF